MLCYGGIYHKVQMGLYVTGGGAIRRRRLLLEVPLYKEEQEEAERILELEEIAAESRTIFYDKTRTMNMKKKKVTDYRVSHNNLDTSFL